MDKKSLGEQVKASRLQSEKLLYKFIKAKAEEDGIKVTDKEIEEFFEDIYWTIDSLLDTHIHNAQTFTETI